MVSYKYNEQHYFSLFSNTILSFGAKTAIIFDLHHQNYIKVPKSLGQILEFNTGKTVAKTLEFYKHEYDDQIRAFYTKLVESNLAFYTSDPARFPKLETDWKSPAKITNSIIEISDLITKEVFEELDSLTCKSLELRILNPINMDQLTEILIWTKDSMINNIELVMPFFESHNKDLEELSKKNLRINSIILYNCEVDDTYSLKYCEVYLKKQHITEKHCGVISASYFVSNIESYTESLHYNSCLNRKISIDAQGHIKNCPSMSQSFGNIQDTTLTEALAHPDFKKTWSINKDKIHVCKDCEFRYICTDCRAYVEDPDDILSKPLKCGYNPYTGEWSEWTNNPLKQKAIDFYQMKEIIPTEKV